MSEPTDPFSATTDVRALGGGAAQSRSTEGMSISVSELGGPVSASLAAAGTPLAEGEIIAGKYKIERVLGQGGVGVVLAATHLRLKQRVAIKLLLSNAAGEMTERFLREAQAAVKLKSEHAAKVLDVGELPNGAPYMVMEFLEGSDLSDHLMYSGPLPVEEAVEYILQACEAMAEAHAAGIVHRDLKPANLFLTQAGGRRFVKVLDFGISKDAGDPGGGRPGMALTKTAAVFGSPLYMPPEQMRSARDVDARSDIWSLGVVLYELLTGKTPFDAELYPDLVLKITVEPAAAPSSIRRDLPSKLDAVILKCLEKKSANRYQDVGKLCAALAPFAPAHARGSVDRIQRTLEAGVGPMSGASMPPRSAAQASTGSALRPSSARAASGGLLWKVVAVTVVGSTALVLGAAALLGAFSGQPEKGATPPIAPATESSVGVVGAVGAPTSGANSGADKPVGVAPAGDAMGGVTVTPAVTPSRGGTQKTGSAASAQPAASGVAAAPPPPSAQPSSAPAPATAAPPPPPTTAAPPPPPPPPPVPTKKNPLDMDVQ